MKYLKTSVPAALLIGGLLTFSASAQEAAIVPTPTGPTQEVDTPPTPGTAEHAAQIRREHDRAVVSGDHANDPLNPTSSNALNQQEAGKAAVLGNEPVPADNAGAPPPVAQPVLPDSSVNVPPSDPDAALSPPPTGEPPLKVDPATIK